MRRLMWCLVFVRVTESESAKPLSVEGQKLPKAHSEET